MSEAMIIIGAGHAAVRAALAIREAGYAGQLVMIAEEGSDLPYERPPLSKWSGDGEFLAKPIVSASQLEDARIERVAETVTGIDTSRKVVTLGSGTTRAYSKLLLAAGASPRRLPEALTGQSPVYYLRDAADARKIRQAAQTASHALIVGGGFIGLELAASLRGAGIAVHVIEAADRLLSRAVSAEVSQIVQQLHEAHEVRFSVNAVIDEIALPPGVVRMAGNTEITADLIIAGVGSIAKVELAQSAGLHINNGISVDAHLCTSDPHIFAAGDCCNFPLYGVGGQAVRLESWQAAGDQGALAGLNMVATSSARYTNVPWFWSEQYDHVLQVAGLPDQDMQFVQRSYDDTHHITFGISNDGLLGYACGIAPGLKVAKDIRFAMKLIENATPVDKDALADPTTTLKSLR